MKVFSTSRVKFSKLRLRFTKEWWVVHLGAAVGTEQKAGKQSRLAAQAVPGASLCLENRPDFFAGVAGIPLVKQVAQRGKVIFPLFAVYAVVLRNKVDVVLREKNLCVHSYLWLMPLVLHLMKFLLHR